MTERGFTLETHYAIYDDKSGDKIVVRPDTDALGLIEIIGEQDNRIIMPLEQAKLVAKALLKLTEGDKEYTGIR